MPVVVSLSPGLWLLTFLPIAVLLVTIIGLRWGAPKAGAAAWFVAVAVAVLAFGSDERLIALANAKGLSLSVFVLSIIWSAVFLYNVVEQLDGPRVIGATLSRLVADPLLQSLLIAWCFSSFLQGITGFGVPVAVAAPLLIIVGVPPVRAAVMALVGHSWAVTFGSVGASYYTIQLVTRLAPELIAPWMALSFALPIVACGFGVAHVHGGLAAVRRAAVPVLVASAVMALLMWLFAYLGAPHIASTLPALAGCVVLWAVGKRQPKEQPAWPVEASDRPRVRGAERAGLSRCLSALLRAHRSDHPWPGAVAEGRSGQRGLGPGLPRLPDRQRLRGTGRAGIRQDQLALPSRAGDRGAPRSFPSPTMARRAAGAAASRRGRCA